MNKIIILFKKRFDNNKRLNNRFVTQYMLLATNSFELVKKYGRISSFSYHMVYANIFKCKSLTFYILYTQYLLFCKTIRLLSNESHIINLIYVYNKKSENDTK